MTPLLPHSRNSPHEALPKADVLLVTANTIDTKSLLEMHQKHINKPVNRHYIANHTYYDLGVINNTNIWLVSSEPGSGTPSGAIKTILTAINNLAPKTIILVGTALGIDRNTQSIGDILVSRQLCSYEQQLINTDPNGKMKIILRGDRVSASPLPLDRCRDGELDWSLSQFHIGITGIRVHFGLMLSGDKQINDQSAINQLLEHEPEAIGIEMEGAGLYVAANDSKIDWVMIKSISNWAGGDNQENITVSQQQCSQNAADFTFFTISRGGFARFSTKSPPITKYSFITNLYNFPENPYEIQEPIDPSSHGNTFISTNKHVSNAMLYVSKRIEKDWATRNKINIDKFINDGYIINTFYLPDIYEYFESHQLLVMSLVKGESLNKIMVQENHKVNQFFVITALFDTLQALNYLHEQNITHGDIKPQNLILDPKGHTWLVGFGGGHEVTSYTAPEQQQERYELSSDCYSLAMTAAVLLTHKIPSGNYQYARFIRYLREHTPAFDHDLIHLLEEALSEDPEARPSAETMLERLIFIRDRYQPDTDSSLSINTTSPEQQLLIAIDAGDYIQSLSIVEKYGQSIYNLPHFFQNMSTKINDALTQSDIPLSDRIYLYAIKAELLWQKKINPRNH